MTRSAGTAVAVGKCKFFFYVNFARFLLNLRIVARFIPSHNDIYVDRRRFYLSDLAFPFSNFLLESDNHAFQFVNRLATLFMLVFKLLVFFLKVFVFIRITTTTA